MGSGAHVRTGTLEEEEAGGAHTVGLKQTILFPYVVLGSLVNFCDCLMAGGTSRNNHGEVGSSYIHFKYTPHQDKATPSLIGDVPRGVMLDYARRAAAFISVFKIILALCIEQAGYKVCRISTSSPSTMEYSESLRYLFCNTGLRKLPDRNVEGAAAHDPCRVKRFSFPDLLKNTFHATEQLLYKGCNLIADISGNGCNLVAVAGKA